MGRSQSHIAKRLSLLKLPEDVRAEVDSGGITLPDALELAKLVKTPDRLQAALKRGREYGGIEAAVRRQEQELQQEATRAKMVKELKGLGVTVLEWPDRGWWDAESAVTPLRNLYWVDGEAHAGEPCHAVSVAPYGETVGVCTDSARHPRPQGDPYTVEVSEERRAQQEEERARQEALAHARDQRLTALQEIVGGRIPKAEVVEQLAWSIIETCDWWKAQAKACHILAIDPGEDDEIPGALVAAAEGGPEQALRVPLALTLGTAEAWIDDPSRPEWGRVGRHFGFLERHGYAVSEAEREELEAARRARAEQEALDEPTEGEAGEEPVEPPADGDDPSGEDGGTA